VIATRIREAPKLSLTLWFTSQRKISIPFEHLDVQESRHRQDGNSYKSQASSKAVIPAEQRQQGMDTTTPFKAEGAP
jgi:hypothetical protein